jgi:hypothetical protein
MLDLHASVGTPGAVLTLTKLATLIPTDGLNVVGVPLRTDARLVLWGCSSKIANTIAIAQLLSQDNIDSQNGETVNLGSASLKNLFYKFMNLAYNQGARNIYEGSNTAQTADSLAITLDWYNPGNKVGDTVSLDRFVEDTVIVPQTLTADVAKAWVNTPLAPATPIPNGKYALLGFWISKTTEAHLIRFGHADFGFCLPGIPTVDNMIATAAEQGMNDLLHTNPGYQFIVLSDITRKPCVPTFTVSNAATGLNIESIAATATDTPVVSCNLAKIG